MTHIQRWHENSSLSNHCEIAPPVELRKISPANGLVLVAHHRHHVAFDTLKFDRHTAAAEVGHLQAGTRTNKQLCVALKASTNVTGG